jgi:hypothetical protein
MKEGTSIYSWRSPCFAGDALFRLTGDHHVASLAITLSITPNSQGWHRNAAYSQQVGRSTFCASSSNRVST